MGCGGSCCGGKVPDSAGDLELGDMYAELTYDVTNTCCCWCRCDDKVLALKADEAVLTVKGGACFGCSFCGCCPAETIQRRTYAHMGNVGLHKSTWCCCCTGWRSVTMDELVLSPGCGCNEQLTNEIYLHLAGRREARLAATHGAHPSSSRQGEDEQKRGEAKHLRLPPSQLSLEPETYTAADLNGVQELQVSVDLIMQHLKIYPLDTLHEKVDRVLTEVKLRPPEPEEMPTHKDLAITDSQGLDASFHQELAGFDRMQEKQRAEKEKEKEQERARAERGKTLNPLVQDGLPPRSGAPLPPIVETQATELRRPSGVYEKPRKSKAKGKDRSDRRI